MRNKIIKVSIILIFMMFSVCLFNFCFAYSIDIDIEISNTVSLYYSSNVDGLIDIFLYKINSSYNECNTEHEYKLYYLTANGLLRCVVSDKPIILECTQDWRYYVRILEEDGSHSLPYCDRYSYNEKTGEWSFYDTMTGNGNFNSSTYTNVPTYLLNNYTQPILYGYATADSTELIQMYS